MNDKAVSELMAMKHLPKYQPTSLTMEEYQRDMDMIFHCSGELSHEALRYYDANGLILGAGDHLVILFSESGVHTDVDYRWISDRYRLVLKLLSHHLEGKYRYYAAETDGRLMVLVCFPWHYSSFEEQSKAAVEIEQLCAGVIQQAGEEYALTVSAYVSQFCNHPKDITQICDQVRVYMEYQRFLREDVGVRRIALSGKPLAEVTDYINLAEKTAQLVVKKIYNGQDDFLEETRGILAQLTEYPPYDVSVFLSNAQRMITTCYDIFLAHHLFSTKDMDDEVLAENYLYRAEELRSISDVETRFMDFFGFAFRQYHREKAPWEGTIDLVPEYIRNNFTRQELSVNEIAEAVSLKTSTMCAAYKRKTGQTVFEYILQLRLELAEKLMEDRERNLREICDQSGFGSIESMYRAFKKMYGMSPGQFRAAKQQRKPI